MRDLGQLVEELNALSYGRPFGSLQLLRKQLKHLAKAPSRTPFTQKCVKDHYAFHLGGRTEIQFNVGYETIDGHDHFRHGLAFSLEPSQTLPDIERLAPSISRFNEFVRVYPDALSNFRMWHFAKGRRSENYPVCPIPAEIVRPRAFIFIGKLSLDTPDGSEIIEDFDGLLPVYEFVEGEEAFPYIAPLASSFDFKPGCSLKPSSTSATVVERTISVALRHNDIQAALHGHLAARLGTGAVGTEISSGAGTRIDVVMKRGERYYMFEIKTAQSARACIREALGQLLEYSYWPGTQRAEELLVVGEPALDADAAEYLRALRGNFSMPIRYCQYRRDTGSFTCAGMPEIFDDSDEF
jgi:hypothetical protein